MKPENLMGTTATTPGAANLTAAELQRVMDEVPKLPIVDLVESPIIDKPVIIHHTSESRAWLGKPKSDREGFTLIVPKGKGQEALEALREVPCEIGVVHMAATGGAE